MDGTLVEFIWKEKTEVFRRQIRSVSGVRGEGGCLGGLGVQSPPPEIPKALQNRAKLNLIVKNVKNC